MATTIFMIGYIGGERPYVSPFSNKQELLNEMIVLVAAYPLLTFTDFVWELDTRIDNGFFIIGCILLNIIANMIVVIVIAIHSGIRKCKLYFLKKRQLQALERI